MKSVAFVVPFLWLVTRASVSACPACSETIARNSQDGFGAAINISTIAMIAVPILLVTLATLGIRSILSAKRDAGTSRASEPHSTTIHWRTRT